jgi:PKD repeat protein
VFDGGPPPLTLRWDFGDGEVSNSEAPRHIFQTPGAYIVTLHVTFKNDIFRESMKQIVVQEP